MRVSPRHRALIVGAAVVLCLSVEATGCGLAVGLFRLVAGDGRDGGLVDGGPVDGGPVDGGPVDGGLVDGGLADGGLVDGGLADGGDIDAGVDAGPCGPCGDDFCVTTADVPYCTPECATGFLHDGTLHSINAALCPPGAPCYFEEGRWLCRPDLDYACEDAVGDCIGDELRFLGCVDGSAAVAKCPAETPSCPATACYHQDPPPGWTCGAQYYGGLDGCDCGCGAPDPDCPGLTADVCDWCTGCLAGQAGESCECTWHTGECDAPVDPADNTTCVE